MDERRPSDFSAERPDAGVDVVGLVQREFSGPSRYPPSPEAASHAGRLLRIAQDEPGSIPADDSWQIGGSLGIAVMTSVAMAAAAGSDTAAARVAGFQTAFTVAAAVAAVGLVAVLVVLRSPQPRSRRPDAVTSAGPQ